MPAARTCRFCQHLIPSHRVTSISAVCPNCGINNELEVKPTLVKRVMPFVLPMAITAGIIFVVNKYLSVSWTSAYAVGRMSKFEVEVIRNKCLEIQDGECVIAAYRRLRELSPDDPEAEANLARAIETWKRE